MVSRREFHKYLLGGGTALLASGGVLTAESAVTPEPQAPQRPIPIYDLLIKGGTVVDPGQQLNAVMDVAVKDGMIAKVSKDIPEASAAKVVSAKDRIVTPGFIDIHTHCNDQVAICVNADHSCLARGVTTVVDAGSAGYSLIANFRKYVVGSSTTRIRILVNIGACGTAIPANYKIPENLVLVNPQLTAQAVEANRPVTVGVKVQLGESIQGANDVECLKRAVAAAEIVQLPLMVHIDGPHSPLPDLLKLMRKGDVYTHCFNNHQNGMLDSAGKILATAMEARERGVYFDIAQGQGHLSFDVAEKCLKQNFFPDTISTDLTTVAVERRVFDLPTMVSKMMAVGIDLSKAVAMVTVNPARIFDYGAKIGTLAPGNEADISIFDLEDGKFDFEDADGIKRSGRQRLVNKAAVRHGQFFANGA